MSIVIVDFQQEGICHIHFERINVLQHPPDFTVLFLEKSHFHEMQSVTLNICHNLTDWRCRYAPVIRLKGGIHLINIWNTSLLDRQVIAHETVELRAIPSMEEALLHRIPVLFVQLDL